MRIVMITSNDPAGTAISFTQALNRYTEHTCRLITTEVRYNFMFEKDLHVPALRNFDELETVLRQAELFHFHMLSDERTSLGPFCAQDFLRKQPLVHHHHGEPQFRADPRRFAQYELALGRRALVSTPDLLRGYPEATWMPNPVPLDAPGYQPFFCAPSATHDVAVDKNDVVVAHSPTRRELKNTSQFLAAIELVRRKDPRIRLRLIENTLHRKCLQLKRTSDLCYDHMQGYFGVSSLESLSQGVPTIAGIDDWVLGHIKAFSGSDNVPWVIARTQGALEDALLTLAAQPKLRRELGRTSRSWMEDNWSAKKIALQLSAFYKEL